MFKIALFTVFLVFRFGSGEEAAPAFTKKLPIYQGILYTSKHVNLTCIVECYPECSIVWYKDGVKIDVNSNHLYTVENNFLPSNLQKNGFVSINSTLIWNMTAWPGQILNKTAANTNYTCQATSDKIGVGVSSTTEIAVEYPPENVHTDERIINIKEGEAPNPVKCFGKGRPSLSFQWKKNYTSETISANDLLVLPKMTRSDKAAYICEANNKHGSKTTMVYVNVQYAPECSITRVDKDGTPALVCTALANPQEVTFTWRVKEGNETFNETNKIIQEGVKSYLLLESSVENSRTYYCIVNNSIGFSNSCQAEVADPPAVQVLIEPSGPVKTTEDVTIVITCNVTSGNPSKLLQMRWFHNGILLKEGVPTNLVLPHVHEDVAGFYVCQGMNKIGWGFGSMDKQLIVIDPSKPRMEMADVDPAVNGTDVRFDCNVTNTKRPMVISWAMEYKDLESFQTQVEEVNGKFDTRSSINIMANYKDNGKSIYCTAKFEDSDKTEFFSRTRLMVKYAPIVDVDQRQVDVNESTDGRIETAMLLTSYAANPMELKEIIWYKDGKALDLNNSEKYTVAPSSTLYISNITREDAGVYTVVLENSIGRTADANNSVILNVISLPRVKVLIHVDQVRDDNRTYVQISCDVTDRGNPSELLKVRWIHKGEFKKQWNTCDIIENKSGEKKKGSFCGNRFASELMIDSVQQSHAGNYSCQMMNAEGWGPVSQPEQLIVTSIDSITYADWIKHP